LLIDARDKIEGSLVRTIIDGGDDEIAQRQVIEAGRLKGRLSEHDDLSYRLEATSCSEPL
jgi:hypothetical protein